MRRCGIVVVMRASQAAWWGGLSQSVIRVALIVFAVVLLVDLVRSVDHNYQISRQIRTLTGQMAATRDQLTVLHEVIMYYQTATYKELTARRVLGLAKPGETLVLAPQNRDPGVSTPGSVAPPVDPRLQARQRWGDRPPYEQWWLLFFGPSDQLEAVFGS